MTLATTSTDQPWWKGAVIYQIYPRSFQDSNHDGIGDLNGITQRLEHIARLGADAIWISPFFTSPMRDFGYDIADYCGVDPIFGTLADFDALVARAHALKIKVLIDLVISHTSKDHPWFIESRASRDNPKADWYVWVDPQPDGSPPNNWLSLFGGSAWQFDTRRQQYFMHNFLASQPDLNFHNPQVQDAVLDAAKASASIPSTSTCTTVSCAPTRRSRPGSTRWACRAPTRMRCSATCTTRRSRRTWPSCSASVRCATATPAPRPSARSATTTSTRRCAPTPPVRGCTWPTPST
jgi:hypothetical protein